MGWLPAPALSRTATSCRVVASEYWSKLFLVYDAIRFGRSDAALVRIMAPLEEESPAGDGFTTGAAVEFARAIEPRVRATLFD